MVEQIPLWLRLARMLIKEARPSVKDAMLGVLVFLFGAFFKVKSGDLTANLTWRNVAGALFPIIAALMVFLILHTVRAARSLIALLKTEQVEEEYNPFPSIVVPEPITEKRLRGTPYFRAKTIALAALFIITFSIIGVASWYATAVLDRVFQERQVSASPVVAPSPAGASPAYNDLPIVVNAVITWDKQFLLANIGEVPIYDVQVRGTDYTLNFSEFAQERLAVEFYSVHGGRPDFYNPGTLDPHHRSEPYDLKQKFKFVKFPKNEEKANRPIISEWMCRNYALRITFRDSRTGLRYVAYKVTGSVIGFAIFENKEIEGETGGARRAFIQQIPSFIIAHQKQLFGLADNEREYVLSP